MTSPPPSSGSPQTDHRVREGIALFNQGRFFECHEALEAVWLETPSEGKQFLQGLIQIAVAFYHLRRENFVGASRLLRAGVVKLRNSHPFAFEVDSTSLLEQIGGLPDRIERGEIPADWPAPHISIRI